LADELDGLLLIVSRCHPLFRIVSRDGRAMESRLLDNFAVPLLSDLSRGTEGFSDLAPGKTQRQCTGGSVKEAQLLNRRSRICPGLFTDQKQARNPSFVLCEL
jgi:hypothetical protein